MNSTKFKKGSYICSKGIVFRIKDIQEHTLIGIGITKDMQVIEAISNPEHFRQIPITTAIVLYNYFTSQFLKVICEKISSE